MTLRLPFDQDLKPKITSELKTPGTTQSAELKAELDDLQAEVNTYLDRPIVHLDQAVAAQSHLDLAQTSNAILALTAHVQRQATGADISIVSMNNNTLFLPNDVKVRDILRNYPFDNTLFHVKLTGAQLKQNIEKTAEYFALENQQLVINPKWLIPKTEHYNYDFYYGLTYTIDVSKPVGSRVTKVSYQGKTLLDDQVLTVALNNYRAVGGGEYNAYKKAEVIQDTGLTIQDLMIAYLEKTGQLVVDEPLDFNINY